MSVFRYLSGLFTAISLASLGILVLRFQATNGLDKTKVLFDPPIIDTGDDYILPKELRCVNFLIANRSHKNLVVNKVQCDYHANSVNVAISKGACPPFTVPSGGNVRVPVEILCLHPDLGRLRIDLRATGTLGNQPVECSAIISAEFAQHLNPSPVVIAFGSVKRGSGVSSQLLRLWHPVKADPPQSVTVSTSDPSIRVEVASCSDTQSKKVFIRDIQVSILPDLIPLQMSESVIIRSEYGKFSIPVRAWVDAP